MDNERVQAENFIRENFDELYTTIFHDADVVKPELVILNEINPHAYYDRATNRLLFYLMDGDVTIIVEGGVPYSKDTRPLAWPAWQSRMLHELMHAYQYLIVKGNVSLEGEELCEKYCKGFDEDGKGHGPDFFTAINIAAGRLGFTPDTLVLGL